MTDYFCCRYPSLKAVALEVIYQAGLDMDDSEPTLDWLGYLPEVGLNGRKGAAAALLGNIAEALSLGRSVSSLAQSQLPAMLDYFECQSM